MTQLNMVVVQLIQDREKMIKTLSVDVKTLIPFPNEEISTAKLISNKELINHFSAIITDIYDLNVISTELALDRLNALEQVADPNIKGVVLAGLGGIHTFVGNYINAFAAFHKSIDLVTNEEGLAVVYSELSSLLRKLDYRNEAITIIREALKYSQNEALNWRLNTQLGLCYKFSNSRKSIQILNKSLDYFYSVKNHVRAARILRHIANTHVVLGEYNIAIQIYNEAHALADEHKLVTYKYELLNDRGWLYYLEKEFNQAEQIYLGILGFDPPPYQRSLVLQNLGCLEFDQDRFAEAINYHSQSLQLTTRYEMRDMAYEDYYKLGICHDKLGELNLADKYFSTGYQDLQYEINLELRILGFRKKLLYTYIEFLNRNKSLPNIDVNAEIFNFTMNKSMNDIRKIFHTNLLQLHLNRTKAAPELCQHLGIEPRTYFLHQKKLGLHRGPGIPEHIENNPYFLRYLDSIADMDWRGANKKFETDLFTFLLKHHQHNKKSIADSLKISYQQVLLKTKGKA